uniref:Reverse transcriptase domain-containing protein n=1 Tax=Tanacetum cinerariifolium TaxID=118510 RepID=A0A6L2KEZ3_TANCI|nr:reverse transcriptase domain-containing protein [Tanacetum cinerariifolium]
MILMILTWSLRKILKKSLRRILKKNLKRTLKKMDSPKPPPPESSDSETEMTAEGDHVQKVALEGTRVKDIKLKRELEAAEISNTLCFVVQARVIGVRPGEAIYVLAVYGKSQPLKPTIPSRRLKRRAVERMVQKRVVKAIAEYERNRTNPENAKGVVAPDVHGCSYKTFKNFQPHSFNGTKGGVRLIRWFEKMEQVFEISKIVKVIKGNRKTTIGTTTTTITIIPIIGSRTRGSKLPKLMLMPQLGERFILGIYHYATDVSYITMTSAQLSAKNAKG